MRTHGTHYEEIQTLPNNALPVSVYARRNEMQVGHVYMKYKRHYNPKEGVNVAPAPSYIIRCWQGANYVIPN